MFALTIACEEELKAPLPTESNETIVVEGVLTNRLTNHRVSLRSTVRQLNEAPTPITGAEIFVSDGVNLGKLTEFPLGSGNYYTPQGRAVVGRRYTLTIFYKGKTYQASDSAVAVEPLKPIAFSRSSNNYTIDFSQSGNLPNYVDHFVTWKHTSACDGGDCQARTFFYDLKSIDTNEIFKPDKTDFIFPRQSIVVRVKYSVSPAYRAFLRGMLSETAWRGGVFDVQRANAPTNFSGGALGFFAVSTIVSDTTVVQ